MKLSNLKVGESGVVKSIDCQNKTKKRFNDLGLVVGKKIALIRRSPFGSPLEIKIDRFYLAIRKEDAQNTEVIYG